MPVNKYLLSPTAYQRHCWLAAAQRGKSTDTSHLTWRLSVHTHWLSPNHLTGTLLAARDSELKRNSSFTHRFCWSDRNKNNVVDIGHVLWWRARPTSVKSLGRRLSICPGRVGKAAFKHGEELGRWIEAWSCLQGRENNSVKSIKAWESSQIYQWCCFTEEQNVRQGVALSERHIWMEVRS